VSGHARITNKSSVTETWRGLSFLRAMKEDVMTVNMSQAEPLNCSFWGFVE